MPEQNFKKYTSWSPAAIECDDLRADCQRCSIHQYYGLHRSIDCKMPESIVFLNLHGIKKPETLCNLKWGYHQKTDPKVRGDTNWYFPQDR